MKRKMSFAFAIMCFITLLSLGNVIQIIPNFVKLFKNFSLVSALKTLCNIIGTLTPLAIAALLCLNRKRDVTSKAHVVLIICGCAKLLDAALRLSSITSLLVTPLSAIFPFVNLISTAILGILLIVVATSTKNGTTNGAVRGFGLTGMSLGVFLIIGSIMPDFSQLGVLSLGDSLCVILLSLGLWCLPKTIYDYDACFLFGEGAIKLCALIAGIILIMLLIISSATDSGSSTNRGNCFNCGGDGWDSENSCSCIWCGGDGQTSWNP